MEPTTAPLLALVLMVKDEARSAAAIVASVRDQIDAYVVLDTGSTDGTQAILKEALAGLPGVFVEEPFVDFATSRNRSLALLEGVATFGLLLSGDETLSDPARAVRAACATLRPFRAETPNASALNLRVAYGNLAFDSTRVVRAGAGWRYAGVVHEALVCDGAPPPSGRVEGAIVVHAGADPERKRLRLYKDLELLREQTRRDPADARATFYLAQTLEDLGMNAEAHAIYRRRVELAGWRDEAYEAAFRVARTAHRLARPWPEVQQLYLEAHALDARRAEPLFALAQHWHALNEHALAWLFAARGAALPYPETALFVDRAVYAWKLADLAAVHGFYVGEYEAGERFAHQVVEACPGEPRLLANLAHYLARRPAAPLESGATP